MVTNYCGDCDRERRENARALQVLADAASRATPSLPAGAHVISAEAYAALKGYLADEMIRLMEARDYVALKSLLTVIEPVCPDLWAAIANGAAKIEARQASAPAVGVGDVPRVLVLIDVPAPSRIDAIKAIRVAADGLGLKEAKDFIDGDGPAGVLIPAERQRELVKVLDSLWIGFRLDPPG
jgi:ribosomal protein L7/L12